MTNGKHSEQRDTEQEPVTFVDNRKIDPETGEIREPAAEPAAGPGPEDGNGTAAEAPAEAAGGELAERTADLQRLTAEYANYRRRVERDRKTAIDAAKAAVVTELLGVLDDLDRARAHGDLDAGPLKSVADKLAAALQKQGLEEFGSAGEPFDPTLHEAVQHEGSGHEPVIGLVMRKGYRFGDRVLRHALVGVTDAVAEQTGSAQTEASDADAGANKQ
ncbi:nucleotide exchange factor GrpE [Nocardia brasiliensis]|uniref:Protein GrpE n=1 Tax=Nocardia brasiliensis (strain ATCC 700358 / HUJEG-1) TaxID=1133849 RepID=K0F9E8_NOCB7|nr:nucleotide exchange factor GrpE [Nocardia brasiliensis]AFU06000.1 protein GrpE [Nocardia brasiliensis ATCC 700358]OCF90149.1 molecular chaperone GrpE [Nocardia brasiliensis]